MLCFETCTEFLECGRQKKSNKYYISKGSSQKWQYKTIHTKFRSIISDQKRRNRYQKLESINLVLKSLQHRAAKKKKQPGMPLDLSNIHNIGAFYKSSTTKIRNRCIITARATALKPFGLSRIIFRQMARLGSIPGMTKSINR